MSDESKDSTPTDPLLEGRAMGKLAEAVAGLDSEATARVLRWAVEFYRVTGSGSSRTTGHVGGGGEVPGSGNGGANGRQFADLADLYAATAPEPEMDKALV